MNTGNIVFDEDYAMVLVNEFTDDESASSFIARFISENDLTKKYPGEILYPLVITKENFEIFYETKDLDSYLTFYGKHY